MKDYLEKQIQVLKEYNLALIKAKELISLSFSKDIIHLLLHRMETAFSIQQETQEWLRPASGDVLTGIITGLLAQKYSSFECLHFGRLSSWISGRYCCKRLSEEALIAGDIVDHFGNAFKEIAINSTRVF